MLNIFKIFCRKVCTNTHASKLEKPNYSNLKPFSRNLQKDCSLANDKCNNILEVLCRSIRKLVFLYKINFDHPITFLKVFKLKNM